MPREKLDADEEVFAIAVAKAMLALRVIAGKYPVCPRCYADAVIGELEEIIEAGLDHGEALRPLTPAEYTADSIGKTEGSA